MHQEYEDLLLLYTTHSLDQTDRQRLEQHLQTCEHCRASLKEWRAISAAVRRSAKQQVASLPPLRLSEQEKNRMQSTHALPERHHYVPVTFAAIAAMLVFTVAVLFFRAPGSTLSVFVQPTAADTVEIVMPTHPIRADRRIDSDDVALVSIPIDVAPANRLTSLDDVIGKFTRTDIFCGQPLLADMVADHSPYVPAFHDFLEINTAEECNVLPSPADELVNIVVARQAIHQWETIGEDMVELRPYPSQLVPSDVMLNTEDVVGDAAITEILQGQFVVERLLTEFIPPLIPENTVRVHILLANNAASIARENRYVDLNTTFSFVDDYQGWRLVTPDTAGATSTSIQIARNAFVIGFPVSENGEVDADRLIVAVPLNEAMILRLLFEDEIPVIVSPASANLGLPPTETTSQIIPENSLEVPDGMVAIYVPLDRVTLVFGQENVIDIYAPEIGELLQGTPVAPVLSPDGSYLAPSSMIQVADNAQIIPSSGRRTLLPVAVSPEEAELLRHLIENNFPLTLVDAGLIERTLASNASETIEIPDGTVAVSVPRTSILAGPVGQLSDRVDIVATVRFADVDEQLQVLIPTGTPPDTRLVTQQVISNALHILSEDPEMMVFAVSPDDAVILTWLVEARIPLILVSPGSWPGDSVIVPANP